VRGSSIELISEAAAIAKRRRHLFDVSNPRHALKAAKRFSYLRELADRTTSDYRLEY